jgi:branched-subunit amino acid transport protein
MIWAIIIITGLLTFVMRFVMLSGIAPRKLPAPFEGARGFVPIAVLTAILVPAVLIGEDNNIMLLDNAHLPAAIIAVVVARISRSIFITISAGLGALWLMTFMGFP